MRIKLSDLAPGVNYAVQVRANNGSAVSQWSRVFNLTTSSDTVPPKTPTGLVGSMTGTSFNLTWDAVIESADNSPAHDFDHYDVKVESTGTATVRVYAVQDTKFLYTLEMNREAFTAPRANIKMSVRAVDKTGNASAYSSIVDQTNAAPAAVTGLVGTSLMDAIHLKWNAVADTDLAGYRVYSGTVAGTQTTLVWEGSTTATTLPSTLYGSDRWYKVVAIDVFSTESTGVAVGPLRPGSPFTVDTTAPAVPTNLAATLTNAADGKTAKAVVTWTAVTDTDGDLSEYILDYKPSSESAWDTTKVDYEKTTATLVGLLPYVNYDFRIRASDWSANLSAWSATVTKTATANSAPATVTGVAAISSRDAVTVAWNENSEPDVANGAGVYSVQLATNAAFTTGLLSYRTGATAITVSGLTPATTYYSRVKAVDSLGLESTAWSTTVSTTLGGAASDFKYTTSATEPTSPNQGDIWMDTTSGFEKQRVGSSWVNTGNVTIKYVASKGTDLITNGTGLMGTNYNFSTFLFNPADSPEGSSGSFVVDTTAINQVRWADETVPVDPSKPYQYSYQIRQTMPGGTGRAYGAIMPLDAAGTSILPNHYTYMANTSTTLTAPLNPGDTTVSVSSSANWRAPSASQYIIFWNWVDQFGKTWGPGTYSRNVATYSSTAGNVITLNAPYAGPALSIGHPVANSNAGGSYIYLGAVNSLIPETWTRFAGMLQAGVHDGSTGLVATAKVPQGTAYVRPGFLANYTTTAGTSKLAFAMVSLSDAAAAQATADTALASANGKNKIIHSTAVATGTVGYVEGDTWVRYDGSNQIIGQWRFASGAWVSEQISSAFIANLDAGKLTANSAFVTTLNVGTGGVIQSAGYTAGGTSGFQLSTTGLTIKGTNNVVDAGVLKGGIITGTTINVGTGGSLIIDATGELKSNNYAAGSTGYKLSNTGLEINDGSVDAKVLKANSAIVTDLTIGRSADALGTIKSFDYSAGVAGWKIGKNLFEINNGLISASALKLQNSPNLVLPQYADFENVDYFYISAFWHPRGRDGIIVANGLADALIAVSGTDNVKGKQYISIDALGNTGLTTAYFGTSTTDYNVDVEPGKTYIFSLYMKNRAAAGETWTVNIKGNTGSQVATQNFVLSANEAQYVRRTFAFTVPAGVNKILPWLSKAAGAQGALLSLDCMQIEEKTGADNTPSTWSPPGSTTADASGITTGLLRSSNNITIAGVAQPAWSLNTQGNLQIGDALVRGKLVVGTSTEGLPNRAPSNGNFETNVTGYSVAHTGATSTAIVRTTTGGEVITGTGSAKVTAAAGSKTALGIFFNTPEQYQPNTIVTVTANVKTNTTNAGSFINVEFIDASSNVVDTKTVVADPASGTVYPVNTSFAVGLNQNVNGVRIVHSGSITATSVIFDDIGLTASSELGQSVVQSANFQPGDQGTGWRIGGQGDVEFNQGYFRGTLGAGIVTSDTLSSTISMATTFIAGTAGGRRVEFGGDGIIGYRTDSTVMLQLPTDDRAAMFDGDLLASSLTISDQLAIRGENNELSRGATLTLQSGTTSPTSPPTVTIDWKTLPVTTGDPAFDAARYGVTYQGGWIRVPVQIYGTGAFIESYDPTTGARQWGSLNISANDGIWTVYGGITSIGNSVYVLGQTKAGEWRIMGFTLSTAVSGTPTRFLNVAYPQNARHRRPAIGTDGTNLLVGFSNMDTNLVYIWSFNATTGALINPVSWTTNLTLAADLSSINKGVFDSNFGQSPGGQVFVITSKGNSYAHVLNTSYQRILQYDFPLIAKSAGQTFYAGKFYTLDAAGGRLQEHTNMAWNGSIAANNTWHAANTWYNTDATNGNKQTTMGAIKTFTMKQRARLTVTSPPIPIRPVPNTVDDATAVGVYLARNSTTPSRLLMEHNGYLADGVRSVVYEDNTVLILPTVGTNASVPPPSLSNFPDSSPSVLKTENAVFTVAGDGTGNWGDMQLLTSTGKVTHSAREFVFTPNSSWTNYGAPYGTAKFFRTADGMWTGSGLMKTTGTVSIPGTATGVAIGVITGYTGASQQMMPVSSSVGSGDLALEIRTGGAVWLRSMTGSAYSMPLGQYVSFSGMTFHEAAA